MTEQIKPCPFCGGAAHTDTIFWVDNVAAGDWNNEDEIVQCEQCGAMTTRCKTDKEAVELWNRRAEK